MMNQRLLKNVMEVRYHQIVSPNIPTNKINKLSLGAKKSSFWQVRIPWAPGTDNGAGSPRVVESRAFRLD